MRPSLFIGSSKESRHLAYALQENLEDDAEVTVWTQGVFDLSRSTLSSLLETLGESEYAAFVFADDDVAKIRSEEVTIPRDNVILEMGIALGCLGPERTFFVVPKDQESLRIPTDLAGITPARYDSKRSDRNWPAALGPAANRVRAAIQQATPMPFDDQLLERIDALGTRIHSLLIHSITHSAYASQFPTEAELRELPVEELAHMEAVAHTSTLGEESVFSLNWRLGLIRAKLFEWAGEEWQSESVKRETDALERDVAMREVQWLTPRPGSHANGAPTDSA